MLLAEAVSTLKKVEVLVRRVVEAEDEVEDDASSVVSNFSSCSTLFRGFGRLSEDEELVAQKEALKKQISLLEEKEEQLKPKLVAYKTVYIVYKIKRGDLCVVCGRKFHLQRRTPKRRWVHRINRGGWLCPSCKF